MEPVTVEAYAGGSYPGHPRAVTWRGKRYLIETVERRWRAPTGLFYMVLCHAGPRLTLHYDDSLHYWQAEVSTSLSPTWMDADASTFPSSEVQEDR